MAQVIEENGELVIRLSLREKIFALHGNPRAKAVDLIATTESENPWSKEVLRGVRAPRNWNSLSGSAGHYAI